MATKVWTDEQRERALEIYLTDGPSVASEQTGIPIGTISSWAHRTGVHTLCVEKLTQALGVQNLTLSARRSALAERLYAEADAILDQLWEPAVATHFDRDGGFHRGDLAEPVFRDKQSIVTSAAILIDKAQLLSGEATERPDVLTPEQRRERTAELVDELERRRDERQAS